LSEVEQVEARINGLAPRDLAKLRAWFAEFDARVWDEQLEADSATGELDHLIEKSLAEHKAGKSTPL
jgi:hypothetical protein